MSSVTERWVHKTIETWRVAAKTQEELLNVVLFRNKRGEIFPNAKNIRLLTEKLDNFFNKYGCFLDRRDIEGLCTIQAILKTISKDIEEEVVDVSPTIIKIVTLVASIREANPIAWQQVQPAILNKDLSDIIFDYTYNNTWEYFVDSKLHKMKWTPESIGNLRKKDIILMGENLGALELTDDDMQNIRLFLAQASFRQRCLFLKNFCAKRKDKLYQRYEDNREKRVDKSDTPSKRWRSELYQIVSLLLHKFDIFDEELTDQDLIFFAEIMAECSYQKILGSCEYISWFFKKASVKQCNIFIKKFYYKLEHWDMRIEKMNLIFELLPRNLRELDLHRCQQITELSFSKINHPLFKKVVTINLNRVNFYCIDTLKRVLGDLTCSNLEELRLQATGINRKFDTKASDFKWIAENMPKLKILDLKDNNFTIDFEDEIQQYLPNVKVII